MFDITQRLRQYQDTTDTTVNPYLKDITMSDAAHEIEQLRHQIQQWKATATLFYLHHDNRRNCSLITSCKECDAYEELIQKEQQ